MSDFFCLGDSIRFESPYSYMQTGYMSNGAVKVERVNQPCEVSGTITAISDTEKGWAASALVNVPIVNPVTDCGRTFSERKDIVCITEANQLCFFKD